MDALTTANQNQTVALNSISTTNLFVNGQYTSKTYDDASSAEQAAVQIASTAGRLVNVCVVASGSGQVKFYNTASVTSILPENLLYVLDANAKLGVTLIGQQFSDGLAMVIGTGVSANVTFSVGK